MKRNRASIEVMERRLLMTVIPVLHNGDAGADTLRDAIAQANDGDTIDLSARSGTITLASQLTVDKSLIFKGPGAGLLTIDGGNTTRPFFINSGKTVEIDDLTIANGGLNGGIGGGIYGSGATLTLDHVAMTNNLAA